jgi:hypothetical protein
MNEQTRDNQKVIDWARSNLAERVEIRSIAQNRLVMVLTYGALFLIPGLFMLVGILSWLLGGGSGRDKTPQAALACGFVLLIPMGIIVLVGYLTRQRFPRYLDAEGVYSPKGEFLWRDLAYVDHVTKFVDRRGLISDRKIEDNNLDLVFTQGTVTIPPLIKDKERIWRLIHSIPCEHRKK